MFPGLMFKPGPGGALPFLGKRRFTVGALGAVWVATAPGDPRDATAKAAMPAAPGAGPPIAAAPLPALPPEVGIAAPPEWRASGGLHVVTGARTDFWQRTHYGFRRDDGHVYHLVVAGDFNDDGGQDLAVIHGGNLRIRYGLCRHDAVAEVSLGLRRCELLQ